MKTKPAPLTNETMQDLWTKTARFLENQVGLDEEGGGRVRFVLIPVEHSEHFSYMPVPRWTENMTDEETVEYERALSHNLTCANAAMSMYFKMRQIKLYAQIDYRNILEALPSFILMSSTGTIGEFTEWLEKQLRIKKESSQLVRMIDASDKFVTKRAKSGVLSDYTISHKGPSK